MVSVYPDRYVCLLRAAYFNDIGPAIKKHTCYCLNYEEYFHYDNICLDVFYQSSFIVWFLTRIPIFGLYLFWERSYGHDYHTFSVAPYHEGQGVIYSMAETIFACTINAPDFNKYHGIINLFWI